MFTPPKILFDATIRNVSFIEQLLTTLDKTEVKGITLLIGADYPCSTDSLNKLLKTLPIPVSGGVFPEVIYQGLYYANAVLVLIWYDDIAVHTYNDANNPESCLYQQLDVMPDEQISQSSLIFTNTQPWATEAALDALFYRNGQIRQFTGAGSSYGIDSEQPSIVTNEGMVSDAIQVTCFPYPSRSTVLHGWSILSGPHLVTESHKNRLVSLDYHPVKPHFEKTVRSAVGDAANNMSFEQLINQFPVGIQPYDEEMVVRDILCCTDEAMEFIGDIPGYANIYILKGDKSDLLEHVINNVESLPAPENASSGTTIIFSCFGRRQHMEELSETELHILNNTYQCSGEVIGVSSMGEIATNNTGLARLHSMSLVVCDLWIT